MERKIVTRRKTVGYLLGALLVVMGLMIATMPVAAQGMIQDRIPAADFFDPLVSPCNGEVLQPHGWVLWSQEETPTGFVLHVSGLGAYAIGETSGDVYQINGALQWVGRNGGDETRLHNFRLIGSEPGQRFHLHQLYHATYTPDGNLSVEVDVLDVECR
ncbi:MAG: hypothetical protein ACK2UC_10400 [Anaerolineae bacterium]